MHPVFSSLQARALKVDMSSQICSACTPTLVCTVHSRMLFCPLRQQSAIQTSSPECPMLLWSRLQVGSVGSIPAAHIFGVFLRTQVLRRPAIAMRVCR